MHYPILKTNTTSESELFESRTFYIVQTFAKLIKGLI